MNIHNRYLFIFLYSSIYRIMLISCNFSMSRGNNITHTSKICGPIGKRCQMFFRYLLFYAINFFCKQSREVLMYIEHFNMPKLNNCHNRYKQTNQQHYSLIAEAWITISNSCTSYSRTTKVNASWKTKPYTPNQKISLHKMIYWLMT